MSILLCGAPCVAWEAQTSDGCDVWVRGFAHHDGATLNGQRLAADVVRSIATLNDGQEAVAELLRSLNGTFAVVAYGEDILIAAVDRLRSIPLFYGIRDGRLILSDDARWVQEQVGDAEPDSLSVTEFLLAGYVTGSDTLFPHVKQLQAGEMLCWRAGEADSRLSLLRYYRWIHGNYAPASLTDLRAELDSVHLRVFERLVESMGGRTLVVPLSGGLDSRLIVSMLKRLGHTDVICFSYGRPGNRESTVSKTVAKELGYPWLFVPYDSRSWHAWYESDEWQAYSRYAAGLCSVPLIQDWPAVWNLRRQDSIPLDAVLVPGHTGDFVSGGHIPVLWQGDTPGDLDTLLGAIQQKHYALRRGDRQVLQGPIRQKNESALRGLGWRSAAEMASAFEYWEWQERQAKFIVNSVRVYEFWGYEWRLPLWDNEIMEFWTQVPLELRVGKRLYDRLVGQVCQDMGASTLQPSADNRSRNHTLASSIRRGLARSPLASGLRKGRWVHGTIDAYWSHPLAWYRINTFWRHLQLSLEPDVIGARHFGINTLLATRELARWGIVRERSCSS